MAKTKSTQQFFVTYHSPYETSFDDGGVTLAGPFTSRSAAEKLVDQLNELHPDHDAFVIEPVKPSNALKYAKELLGEDEEDDEKEEQLEAQVFFDHVGPTVREHADWNAAVYNLHKVVKFGGTYLPHYLRMSFDWSIDDGCIRVTGNGKLNGYVSVAPSVTARFVNGAWDKELQDRLT